MDQCLLYCFRSWRELADGKVERAINNVFRRPLSTGIGPLVEQIADAGRESEHWQDASVRQSLAQMILREMLVIDGRIYFGNKADCPEADDRRTLRLQPSIRG